MTVMFIVEDLLAKWLLPSSEIRGGPLDPLFGSEYQKMAYKLVRICIAMPDS